MAISLSDLQSIPDLETYRVGDTWEVLRDRVGNISDNITMRDWHSMVDSSIRDEEVMYNSRHAIDYIHLNFILTDSGAEVKFRTKAYDILKLKDELFEL